MRIRTVRSSLLSITPWLALCAACSTESDDSGGAGTADAGVVQVNDDGQAVADVDLPSVDQNEVLIDEEASPEPDLAGDSGLAECAIQKQEASLTPVNLLFLLDQSGSMGDGEHGERTEKWDPVASALKAFFADARSTGMHASLTLFPPDLNTGTGAADSSYGLECGPEPYTDPNVALTELPQGEVFADAIDAVAPPNEWGTPTQPALAGISEQALELLDAQPDAEVVIIMVTDGEPTQCDEDENSVGGTVDVAEQIADVVPTYVIGVGDSLDALNRIAEGGGTDAAFIIEVNDPEQTQQDLIDTFSEIRGQISTCEAAIPEPPAGRRFEKEKVAVEIGNTEDDTVAVEYNPECEDGEGWRYDDIDEPTEIRLCDATCDVVQAMDNVALNVVFACEPLIGAARAR